MNLRDRMGQRSFPWRVMAVLAAAALPIGVVAWFATFVVYRAQPPSCYGIGFGCTLSPISVGGLVGGLWLFAMACTAGALLITELFWERVAEARSAAVLVAAVFGIVGAAWVWQWGTGY